MRHHYPQVGIIRFLHLDADTVGKVVCQHTNARIGNDGASIEHQQLYLGFTFFQLVKHFLQLKDPFLEIIVST